MIPKHDHNVICDVCGFKVLASKTFKRWDGLIICKTHSVKTRHPNDFPPPFPKHEARVVKDARPDTEPVYIRTIPNYENFLPNKVWGSTGEAVWGGDGDPSTWGGVI